MKFLDSKTPQFSFDKMHAFILEEISSTANNESTNNFYIFRITAVLYTLQDDV